MRRYNFTFVLTTALIIGIIAGFLVVARSAMGRSAIDPCDCQTTDHHRCGEHYFEACYLSEEDCESCLITAQLDCAEQGLVCNWTPEQIERCEQGAEDAFDEECIE